MVKVVALIKKKPDLSHEDFVSHYEEVHAPLAVKYFPTIRKYVRNYVISPPGVEEPTCDCISEFWYDDMEGYQAAVDFLKSEAGQVMRDDQDRFMDRDKARHFLVEERISK